MRMNRRNVLMGLGTIVAGGGAVFSSGAFSQVDAERTTTFAITDDTDALLEITGNSAYTDSGSNAISLDLSKLNDNAQTTIDGILTISYGSSAETNDFSTDGFDVEVKELVASDDTEVDTSAVDFQVDGSSVVTDQGGAANTSSDGSAVNLDVVIDTGAAATNGNTATDLDSITIVAKVQ